MVVSILQFTHFSQNLNFKGKVAPKFARKRYLLWQEDSKCDLRICILYSSYLEGLFSEQCSHILKVSRPPLLDKAPCLSIRIIFFYPGGMPYDTVFGDDLCCICFDHPNRETAMQSPQKQFSNSVLQFWVSSFCFWNNFCLFLGPKCLGKVRVAGGCIPLCYEKSHLILCTNQGSLRIRICRGNTKQHFCKYRSGRSKETAIEILFAKIWQNQTHKHYYKSEYQMWLDSIAVLEFVVFLVWEIYLRRADLSICHI